MKDSESIIQIVSRASLVKDYTSMQSVTDAFIASVDAKDTTRDTYRKAIELFFDWINSTGRQLGYMFPQDVIAYKDYLLKENRSSLTVNLYLSVVRRFYKWTKANNLYPNIADGVASVKTNKKTFRKMHLENDEGAALLESVATTKKVTGKSSSHTKTLNENETMIAMRDFAMVNLMLRTGLRTIEVSRADIGDIVSKRGRRILKVWGKGHSEKDDFVVLTNEAYKPIKDYLKHRPEAGPEEPLFACEGLDSKGRRMSTRRIQAICKEGLRSIGLDGHEYSAHSLRHTTGTQILLNGGTMFDVQNVLRHTTPATSQLYVNTIMEDKRLDDASEQLLDGSFKKNPIEGEIAIHD